MNVPEYLCLKGAHETLAAMGPGETCCARQTVEDERAQGRITAVAAFLRKAYADERVFAVCHLGDAFHMMGIEPREYKPRTATLARILDEAGKRPLSLQDLDFAQRALDYWSALRANLA